MMIIKTNVKEVVEIIYGSGNLVSDDWLAKRAEQGSFIHREYQAQYQKDDKSEVAIQYSSNIDGYNIIISGRIDGIIKRNNKIIIEEIKSTTKDLTNIDEKLTPAHLAQVKVYGYFYLEEQQLDSIDVRLTYIHVESKQIKQIDFEYKKQELQTFYLQTIKEYLYWIKLINNHEIRRNKSIKGLQFPYPDYRYGQQELMRSIYQNIISKDILYAIAPTGIGKTIATLFPALKSINKRNQKIFYLTAKNLGKKMVLGTAILLMNNGLQVKTIEISSKDSVCFQKNRDCDADKCPYSRNYYGKLFEALKDAYNNEDLFNKETIEAYAKKHKVCPFEFSLDLSYYADIIICDYNYVFCPLTHLQRYFEMGGKYETIVLVDEAHNLSSRSRQMYSGRISKMEINKLKNLTSSIQDCKIKEFDLIIKSIDDYRYMLEEQEYLVIGFNNNFVLLVSSLLSKLSDLLEKHKEIKERNEILPLLLELIRFVAIADYFDEDFAFAISQDKEDFLVNIDCLDAAKFVLRTIKQSILSTIFFSATLYPLPYYMKTLTEGVGENIVIKSPFDKRRLKLILLDRISTKYRNRMESIEPIVDAIRVLGNSKPGNYIVFFPSYAYLQLVYNQLQHHTFDFTYIIQEPNFTAKEREEVIQLFRSNDKTQIGLFVMGGMFSEGIDYIGDMLKGVIIIGVGLPHYGGYNNVAKNYFDRKLTNGFDYAYTYPGFTKVVQAVGRIIRSETDYGVAVFIDDRFLSYKYQNLFPKEWENLTIARDSYNLSETLNNFWNLF